MPTGCDEADSPARAGESARREAELWVGILDPLAAALTVGARPGPTEVEVLGYDPMPDLDRRAGRWEYRIPSGDLRELVRFSAGLAMAEAEAWDADDPTIATRAYEDRRFLAGDRVLPWAVPWADAVGRCHPEVREPAHEVRDALLEIGDRLRPAPAMAGHEGLVVPGEDAFGPVDRSGRPSIRSLLSGITITDATVSSLRGGDIIGDLGTWLDEPVFRRDLAEVYRVAAVRWTTLASAHPGTSRLWLDLAARAENTAQALSPET